MPIVFKNRAFLPFFYSMLLAILCACLPQNTAPGGASRYLQAGEIPEAVLMKNCQDFDLGWMGHEYQIGAKIGSGISGVVFALNVADNLPSEYVVKVMSKKTKVATFNEALGEVRIFNEFAGFFAPAWYKGLYEYRGNGDPFFYGLAIKKRVIGYTAEQVIFDQELGLAKEVLYKKFIEFKSDLIKHMSYMAEQNEVYIWDLHLRNIMYDTVSEKWIFVDANRTFGLNNLISIITYVKNTTNQPQSRQIYSKMRELLLSKIGVPKDEEFFASYLDFYLGGLEDHLKNSSIKSENEWTEIDLLVQ